MILPNFLPNATNTLVVILGASAWPNSPGFRASKAFMHAAHGFRDYVLDPKGFALPKANLFDLFDATSNASDQLEMLGVFLEKRIQMVHDVLVYFVGHGGFAGSSADFYLLHRRANASSLKASGMAIDALAEVLREKARQTRRYVFLDCCFAATAFRSFQGAPDQTAIIKTFDAFSARGKGSGFPKKGTVLFCSSDQKSPSLLLSDESNTMFSYALLKVLRNGDTHRSHPMSLRDIEELAVDQLMALPEKNAPRPKLLSPDYSEGDVGKVPFFPNPRAEEEQRRQAEEERFKEKDSKPSLRLPSQSYESRNQASRKILLGLAIDLSQSMKQNINNNTKKEMSRLEGFQQSLNTFLSAAKKAMASHKAITTIDIFIYGFGLRVPDLEVCDILTFQKYIKKNTNSFSGLKEKLQKDAGEDVVNLLSSLVAPYVVNNILVQAKKGVSDLGDTTISLANLSEYFPEKESYWDTISPYIYGETPLLEAMEAVFSRFEREEKKGIYADKIFCIISDGLPTDEHKKTWSIDTLVGQFQKKNITIASCFVTSKDQTESRHLYSSALPEWDDNDGAKLLFRISSLIPTSYLPLLREQEWKKGLRPEKELDGSVRLFLQANHSSILDRFLANSVLPLLSDKKDRLF